MAGKTLFDKIWDAHLVKNNNGGPPVLYIDLHLLHEVTSPQAFAGLGKRGLKVFRTRKTVATVDHNVPTKDQDKPIRDSLSRLQIEQLETNCRKYGIELFGLNHPFQGVVHVIGPELGLTLPGMTIVCGDSHTSTHGAFGAIAFGIGTSEVEMVLAAQCLLQTRPKNMRITINGEMKKGVGPKDLILYIISRVSASGGTGYFVEYAGPAVSKLSMEGRMTLCNMSIEMGARGGLIAPDQTTYDYIRGREYAPAGVEFEKRKEEWDDLFTEPDAVFDREIVFDASLVEPMITFGTNPGMGAPLSAVIDSPGSLPPADRDSYMKSLEYMGFAPGDRICGKPVDYVFVGSCTNGRIEDLREFAQLVKGRKKADRVTAWIVPGSKQVEKQARAEGLDRVLEEAGFEMRQPGCSACLAMNDDKVPPGKYAVSTSNRNFEGRQGPGSRTLLASPLTAAAAAITGRITDPREFL